jgi:hypothetical protein
MGNHDYKSPAFDLITKPIWVGSGASAVVQLSLDQLLRETDELLAIFTSMVSKLRKSGA